MNSKDFMYRLIISQLQKDGHKSIAEELSQKEGLDLNKASNDLLHVVSSVNAEVKIDSLEAAEVTEKSQEVTNQHDETEYDKDASSTEPTKTEAEEITLKKSEKRVSSRVKKPATEAVPQPKSKASLDKWLWKGNVKRNAKATVSTVDAVDLNESDSHMMVYAAMVHHSADSFMEPDPEDPPDSEKQNKRDLPELLVEDTAVESPKDAGATKNSPPRLQSEDYTGNRSTGSAKRNKNPAACDNPELDQLTRLDISPIKAPSETSEEGGSKEESRGKGSRKRKFNEVESDGPMLKWIQAINIGKPVKRARKDGAKTDRISFKGQQSISGETFTYKNVTYKQPSLLLTPVKIHSIASPNKRGETAPMLSSTPKTTVPLKEKLTSSRKKVNIKNASCSNSSFQVNKKQRDSRNSSGDETESDKLVDSTEKTDKSQLNSNLKKSTAKFGSFASDSNMSPVVVLKSSEILNHSSNDIGLSVNGSSKRVKRSIHLNSDGNESDRDSWEDRVNDAELPNLDIVDNSSNLGVMESFSVDSESEDESFASMQVTVENLLDGLPLDSPTSSPRAKKTSPKKRANKRVSRGKPERKKGHDESFDNDTNVPDKSLTDRPKTAAEKFAELMGE